jgi:hypothetical protein
MASLENLASERDDHLLVITKDHLQKSDARREPDDILIRDASQRSGFALFGSSADVSRRRTHHSSSGLTLDTVTTLS